LLLKDTTQSWNPVGRAAAAENRAGDGPERVLRPVYDLDQRRLIDAGDHPRTIDFTKCSLQ
jgi:hypothetical protein